MINQSDIEFIINLIKAVLLRYHLGGKFTMEEKLKVLDYFIIFIKQVENLQKVQEFQNLKNVHNLT